MKQTKARFPLRKIEYVVRGLSNAGFMSTNLIHLECGHEVSVSTATMYRARCYRCPTMLAPDKGQAAVNSSNSGGSAPCG